MKLILVHQTTCKQFVYEKNGVEQTQLFNEFFEHQHQIVYLPAFCGLMECPC